MGLDKGGIMNKKTSSSRFDCPLPSGGCLWWDDSRKVDNNL